MDLKVLLLSVLIVITHHGVSSGVEGSNILFAHLMVTASHRNSIWPLAEKLAEKGHNLTYVFPMEKKIGFHKNIEEITPTRMIPILKDYVLEYDINYRLNNSANEHLNRVFSISLDLCEAFYDSPEIQEWLARPDLHYDLLILDTSMGECLYGLVHLFRAKHILFAPVLLPHMWDSFGFTHETSYIPSTVLFTSKPGKEMTFFNRVVSTIINLMWTHGRYSFIQDLEKVVKRKTNSTDMPSIDEIDKQASLVLVNSHIVDDFSMALPPYIVSYSGLSCSKHNKHIRKPLPTELTEFIKDSDGFIYVSFGSAVKIQVMPAEVLQKFFDTFESLPHLKFFWRWSGKIPENAPKNVYFSNWFPQKDILAHPKIKGFVTQAGRPSMLEALCAGVPLITFPIFGDQDYNAVRMEYVGGAINLEINDLTVETFRDAISNLTDTDKYSKKMKELSEIFQDRPVDPLDNALYWTEYVLRRENTDLLKPLGQLQTWYQRRMLDVYAFLALSVFLVFTLLLTLSYVIVKYSWDFLMRNNIKNDSKLKSE